MHGASQSRPGDAGRIDDIEALRALAVMMVLVEHVPWLLAPWLSPSGEMYRFLGFWSGVDLFLAISGFVIARSLLPMLGQARGRAEYWRTVLSFWIRRAWRLLPSAWLWLALIVGLSAVFNRTGVFGPVQANLSGARAAVLYYANLHLAHAYGREPVGAIFHYWSLSLEEQFYFVLPFVIFLAGRWLRPALIALVAAQLFIRRVGPYGDLVLAQLRSDALALGVLLATWSGSASYRRLEPTWLRTPAVRWLLPVALVAGLSVLSGPPMQTWPALVGPVALVSAATVWIASYDRDCFIPPGRLKRALCWIGARSYAIYLMHVPVYDAVQELWSRLRPSVLHPSPLHLAVLVASAAGALLLLSELNYRFVETPLRRYGARLAERVRTGAERAAADPQAEAEPARTA